MPRDAASLLEELQAVDESTSVEAKAASMIGPSILETICAFTNEPGLGGGHLLLGVARSEQAVPSAPPYEVVGVRDADKLQADLASQCATAFNRPVRPQVTVERMQGKLVLVVFVEEAAASEKPVYLKNFGLPRGVFRRIGSTDQHGTEDDLIALVNDREVDTYDASIVQDSDRGVVDDDAIRAYRELRAAVNPVAEELTWSDDDLLRSLGALVTDRGSDRLTVAGMLLFGASKALRRCFPMMRIDYVRIPGREWVGDPDRRFDTVEIRAPLILAARRAINAVRDDLPASFSLPEGESIRSSETVLPLRVLREAIVNAVMHRSYRIHGAIQILRYSNRLEVRNPGHSLKSTDRLGEPGSETRNPRIAAVLHEVHMAETKGSGIRAMRELMRQHNLLPPTFESSRRPDQFVATFLFHHFLGEQDLRWLRQLTSERLSDEEARALVFVREAGAIDNAAYRSINRVETLVASAHLRRLRDLGLLAMRGAGSRTYYVPGLPFRLSEAPVEGNGPGEAQNESHSTRVPSGTDDRTPSQRGTSLASAETHNPTDQTHNPEPETHNLNPEAHHLGLPDELLARIRELGRRPPKEAVEASILELCGHRPMSARELAVALGGRDARDLARTYLRPMLERSALVYTIPEMPNHPNQRYTLPPAIELGGGG